MSDCVVDTSVAVKWVLPEPDSADAVRVVADVTTSGGRLRMLDLAVIEGANVIWVRVHRQLITPTQANTALQLLQSTPVLLEPAHPFLPDAFALAVRFDIAVYDALFVAAVQHHNCDGVTADEPLVRVIGATFPSIKLLRNW
jgi:predicted nucleic acid-binding protein